MKRVKTSGPKEQKAALYQLLLMIYGEGSIAKEKSWDWMVTQHHSVLPSDYVPIVRAISEYRNRIAYLRKRKWRPKCDFVIEAEKIIIEYDESQHFTEARRIALSEYPKDARLCFSKQLWEEHCAKLNRHDNSPIYRDEQRAYYDTIRDLEAARHGYKLFRIMEGEFDWESEGAKERLVELLETV